MVLIIALLNDGTIMTVFVDHVPPSTTPDSWDLSRMVLHDYMHVHVRSLTQCLI